MNSPLIEAFGKQFGAAPTHVVRAPGRVNLIGEHIDYHRLPVLPMAVDREIRMLCRGREDGTVRALTLAGHLPGASFELGTHIPSAGKGDWSNYVRGAAQSIVNHQGASRGVDLLVDSTLPLAAGLSSSSALTVAAGLALAQVNGVLLDRHMFAEQMAEAEHYAGTRGGGMDQAVCLLARAGHALHVEFDPVAVRPVPLPANLRVVVAHSLVSAEKSGRAGAAYNERRRIGEAALGSMVAALGLPVGTGYAELVSGGEDMLRLAAETLSGSALNYFRHVVGEARRVARAAVALESSDLSALGGLVDDSHESLRGDYDVSTPELDQLVTSARRGGALGARLTGAGFGGSAIALVTAERTGDVTAALVSDFYEPRGIADPAACDRLLVVRAMDGATVEALP